MADVVSHGLMSTAFAGLIPRRFARTRTLVGALCAASGMWPDLGGWLDYVLFNHPRWAMYEVLHGSPPLYWLLQPPFALHILLDKLFHAPDGGWTTLGWCLELPCALAGVSAFFWTYPAAYEWVMSKFTRSTTNG